jgi:hypothetical protein
MAEASGGAAFPSLSQIEVRRDFPRPLELRPGDLGGAGINVFDYSFM